MYFSLVLTPGSVLFSKPDDARLLLSVFCVYAAVPSYFVVDVGDVMARQRSCGGRGGGMHVDGGTLSLEGVSFEKNRAETHQVNKTCVSSQSAVLLCLVPP